MFAPKAETAAAKEPQAGSSLVANWRIPVEDAGLRRILPFQPGALAPAVFLLSRLHLLLHLTPHQRSSLKEREYVLVFFPFLTISLTKPPRHNNSSRNRSSPQWQQLQQSAEARPAKATTKALSESPDVETEAPET